MRKAVTKRIKITKTGKMFQRAQGNNHFNAKESRLRHNRKKKAKETNPILAKKLKVYIHQA